MSQCQVQDCDRPAVARSLCLMHYKRARAGRPMVEPALGSPDGYGRYGILDADWDSVGCHECGKRLEALAGHVFQAHAMTAVEYKKRHGLPRQKGLECLRLHALRSEKAIANLETAGWRRLEDARDPLAASRARDDDTMDAVRLRKRFTPEVAWENGRKARLYRVVSCPVCGAQWCPLPGGYKPLTCSRACWATLAAWIRESQPKKNAARDQTINAKYEQGLSAAYLAKQYGVTRERIGQIIRANTK